MNGDTSTSTRLQIYPKRYFDASPTWFAWNKLTAADINGLNQERGFEGQNVYFHLNHPMRFVRVVGLVVDVEITRGGKYILMSIDDSSGACIEVKTEFRNIKEDDHAAYPSNTVLDNVDAHVNMGLPTIFVDGTRLNIGTVVKAKGTLDSFRNVRQLKLERFSIVKDTNEEVKAWEETAEWKRKFLTRPWVLTQKEREDIDEAIRLEAMDETEKSRKKKHLDARHAEKRKRHLEKAERRRKQDEEKFNAGALVGSNTLPSR